MFVRLSKPSKDAKDFKEEEEEEEDLTFTSKSPPMLFKPLKTYRHGYNYIESKNY